MIYLRYISMTVKAMQLYKHTILTSLQYKTARVLSNQAAFQFNTLVLQLWICARNEQTLFKDVNQFPVIHFDSCKHVVKMIVLWLISNYYIQLY